MLNQTFMIFIDKYFITMSIPSLHNRGSKHESILLYNSIQNLLAVDFQLSQMHMYTYSKENGEQLKNTPPLPNLGSASIMQDMVHAHVRMGSCPCKFASLWGILLVSYKRVFTKKQSLFKNVRHRFSLPPYHSSLVSNKWLCAWSILFAFTITRIKFLFLSYCGELE